MPPRSHKSEYTVLAVLGLVTVLALLWMALSGLLHEQRGGRTGVHTTRSTRDDGLLVYYTLCERLGLPVERSNRMLLANHLEGVGTVFLIDPLVPVGAVESEDLGTWVTRGGVLVTTEVLANLSPALRQFAKASPLAPKGIRPPRRDEGHFTQVPEKAKSLALARDVSTTFFETADVLNASQPSSNAATSLVEPLFTEGCGVRISQCQVGRGRLILLSDSSFLLNINIPAGDNPVLAANLVSYALAVSNAKKIVFNEFHFGAGGFGQGIGVLAVLLLTTSPGWAVLALTVAGLLSLIYQGRQFGPRRGFGQQRRRSKLEYVRAVGATYRAAGAHRLTLRLIYARFRQQLLNRTGLAGSAANGLVAQELARHGPSQAADYQHILDGCDRLLAQPSISQRQLTATVAQLARLEKEILNGSGNGKQPGR
jgi:hypothetical protein